MQHPHPSQKSLFVMTSVALVLSLLITTSAQVSSLSATTSRFGFGQPPSLKMRKATNQSEATRSTRPTSPTSPKEQVTTPSPTVITDCPNGYFCSVGYGAGGRQYKVAIDCSSMVQTGQCGRASADGQRDGFCFRCVNGPPRSSNADCSARECGPMPLMANWRCPDGSGVGGPTGKCIRKNNQACGWEIKSCARAPD